MARSVRPLSPDRAGEASKLILESFWRFNASQYDDPSRFTRTVTPEAIARLCDDAIMLGAFDRDALIGVIALVEGDHLELLFVAEAYHRNGTARALWDEALRLLETEKLLPPEITMNASNYAVAAYEKLGFIRVPGVLGSHGREINRMIWRAP